MFGDLMVKLVVYSSSNLFELGAELDVLDEASNETPPGKRPRLARAMTKVSGQ